MDKIKKDTAEYLIKLLRSVLDGSKPPKKPDSITFGQLYAMSEFHHVSAMAYYAVEQLQEGPDLEKSMKWKNKRDLNIAQSYMQLEERDQIIRQLTGAGIAILPLKGCLLKEMYPQPDYREMADLDILIDDKKAEQAKKIMEQLGYITEHFNVSNHDNYAKPPYIGVELHRNMLPERIENHVYYKNVWEKAIPDEGKDCCYHFSWDDYYIFMLTHFAKHYFNSGSGIRSIMDIHVFLKKHQNDLHQGYLEKELNVLGLSDFRNTAEQLVQCWFGNQSYTKEAEEMAEYVITSGVYGTVERSIRNRIQNMEKQKGSVRKGKMAYFFSRMFLPYKTMCSLYPFLKKIPILLPICWVLRLLSATIHKRKRIEMELRLLKKAGKNRI